MRLHASCRRSRLATCGPRLLPLAARPAPVRDAPHDNVIRKLDIAPLKCALQDSCELQSTQCKSEYPSLEMPNQDPENGILHSCHFQEYSSEG